MISDIFSRRLVRLFALALACEGIALWAGVLTVSIVLLPDSAWGQVSATASVAGTVLDASRAVIPGAHIVITQTATGFSRTAESAPNGTFVFPTLPVGPYRLTVTKEGFSTNNQTGIVLTVSEAAKLQVTLRVGTTKQSIEVTAAASRVNTTSGTLSQLVDQRQVEDLPLNGRNPGALALLAPGAVNPALNTAGQGPQQMLQFSFPSAATPAANIGTLKPLQGVQALIINGVRSGGVYFSLDGATNVDSFAVIGGPYPDPDAVQEFRVVTSSYGAQYPSAPGGAVNIVTKSGTNEFHGNLFEFLRNGALNARNFFAAKSDNIRRNQFGGTAGGPIIQNKLFIFGSYQGTTYRSTQGGGIQFVPTDAERNGDFSAIKTPLKNPYTQQPYLGNQIPLSDFNPVSLNIMANLPHSTAPDGRVEVVKPITFDENQFVVKSDYVMNSKSRFVVRYFLDNYSQPKSPAVADHNFLEATIGPVNERWQNALIGYDYTAGNMVNEARITFQRDAYTHYSGLTGVDFTDLGANVTPPLFKSIEVIQVAGYFGTGAQNFNRFPRETFTASDGLNIVHGQHQISLGGEFQYLRVDGETDVGQPVLALWNALPPAAPFTSGSPLTDFVLGKVTAFVQGDGFVLRPRGTLQGFYGQDQIRATPRTSLTLGLRWDPYWPFHVLHQHANCFIPEQKSTVYVNAPIGLTFPGDPGCNSSGGVQADLSTIQPRIGFAHSLNQKGTTSIRAGYGIYAMQFPIQSFEAFGLAQPWNRLIFNILPPSISDPWSAYSGGNPFANGYRFGDQAQPTDVPFLPSTGRVFDPNFMLPNVQQWNLTLEHLFRGNILVRGAYVGTKGTHLSENVEQNPAIYIPGQCGGSPCSTTQNTDARRPYQGIQAVTGVKSIGNSSYNALQLTLEKRVTSGLNFRANYTWSKSLDTTSSAGNGTLANTANTVTDPFNPAAYRSVSDFDLPQSFSGTLVWQLPSPRSDAAFSKYVLSHWVTTSIFTWDSGMPFSIYSGVDNSLSGVGQDFADRVPGVSPYLSPDRPRGQVIQEYYNTAAFEPNALGTFGNSGRNILRGPGYINLDLGVMKRIPLTERYSMTFRAEAFNLTNTPQFYSPAGAGANLSTPQAGEIVGAQDPRIIQFGLKISW